MARSTVQAYGARMKLYTVSEVSAETGLSEKAIRRRIEKGTLISQNRANRRLIPASELERLQAELGQGGTPRAAFPSSSEGQGQGDAEGSGGGIALEPIIRELADTREHVERLAREAEREKLQREQAEERALSEEAAREAAQNESLELRARVVQLEAVLRTVGIADPDRATENLERGAELVAVSNATELEAVVAGIQAKADAGETSNADDAGSSEPEAAPRGRLARFLGI